MPLSVEKLERWDEGLEPLVAECRSLPGVPENEERRFQAWVDAVMDRVRHHEIEALAAWEDGVPAGLAGYVRKASPRGYVVRVHYLYMKADHHEPVSAFLRQAEDLWMPVQRVIVEGGPQTLLDEAVGAEGFIEAGYQRFERARLERPLDGTFRMEDDPAFIPLPVERVDELIRLQRVGYQGSPDYLLVDDFGAMVDELLHDPWFSPETSYAVTDGTRLAAALYTFHKGPLAWIASLCVHPETRGQRLASRLMEHALAAYRVAGFQRAGLNVTLENRPARRLYEHMGFSLAERISLLYAKEFVSAASAAGPARCDA